MSILNINYGSEQQKGATGKKVAVIGGGIAGLSAAYKLAVEGHAVTVFDGMAKMGGTLRYFVPSVKMPAYMIADELTELSKLGIEMKNGVRFGRNIFIDDIKDDFDAILLTPGAWRPEVLPVTGGAWPQVYEGTEYLRLISCGQDPFIGNSVVVAGGGNIAMYAAQTAFKYGAEKVFIVNEGDESTLTADQAEIDETKQRAEFIYNTKIDKILGYCGHVTLVLMHKNGEETELHADAVITAKKNYLMGEGFELVEKDEEGFIKVDGTYKTSVDGIFAAGEAIGLLKDIGTSGIKAAEAINEYLK